MHARGRADRERAHRRRMGVTFRALAVVLAMGVAPMAGCGGEQTRSRVMRPMPWPGRASRNAEIRRFAAHLFRAMVHGRIRDSQVSDDELSELFFDEHAARLRVMRRSAASPASAARTAYRPFRETSFDSACIQGATVLSEGGPLGLRAAGATFDRILLAGREGGGWRWAAWVEGIFLLTNRGVVLVQASRFERPRRDHADLELAPCDIRVGGPSDR